MSRRRYVLRRFVLAVVVLVGVMLLTFVVARIVPSDPAALYAGPRPSAKQIADVRVRLGLDQPLPAQFARYVGSILQGDLGQSFKTRRPILDDLRKFLPATLELVIAATLLAVVVGIPVGVLAAAGRGRWFDVFSRLLSVAGVSIPSFWLALLLQLLFFSTLGWLPLGGRIDNTTSLLNPITTVTGFYTIDAAITGNWSAWVDVLRHLVLPTVVLATYPVGLTIRMLRAAMIEVLSEPYITAARAAGLSRRAILFRFALKNAIVPTLTALGLSFAYSITGAFLVETVFQWPGVGKYVTDAVLNVDFPVVMAVTLVVTIIYIAINLATDLVQGFIDPRVNLG
jgi:peptide/nickel transport system permease protein